MFLSEMQSINFDNGGNLSPISKKVRNSCISTGKLILKCEPKKKTPSFEESLWKIHYGWSKSPFGNVLIFKKEGSIVGLAFSDIAKNPKTEQDMKNRWPLANFCSNDSMAEKLSKKIFETTDNIRIMLIGSDFELKVWKALAQIPFSNITSYSAVAITIGNARAVRAVAKAIGKNPVAWLIPCHRVIQKTGGLGGYHWGISFKKDMIIHESHKP